jgi:hypothetical protein
MMTPGWLQIRLPDGSSQKFMLEGDSWEIGRSDQAAIHLPWSQISRKHARLFRRGAQIWVQDCQSRNGVFINGQRLGAEPCLLSDGDTLVLAGVIEMRFQDPAETLQGPGPGRLQGIWIDPDTGETWVDARQVQPSLSMHQMRLLRTLYDQPGRPLSFDELKRVVWPDENPAGISKQALDGLIKRLRQRLRTASPDSRYIRVVRGFGVKLVSGED